MKQAAQLFVKLIAILALLTSSYGAFEAGRYWTAQTYEKAAVANFCGAYNPDTLLFAWRTKIDVAMTEEALSGSNATRTK